MRTIYRDLAGFSFSRTLLLRCSKSLGITTARLHAISDSECHRNLQHWGPSLLGRGKWKRKSKRPNPSCSTTNATSQPRIAPICVTVGKVSEPTPTTTYTTQIPTIHKANPPRTEAETGGQPSAEEVAEDCPCQNGAEVDQHLPFPDQHFEAQFWKDLHLSQPKWDFEAEERLEKERGEREEEVKRSEGEKKREEEEEEDDRDQMARTLTGFFLGFGSDWCGG